MRVKIVMYVKKDYLWNPGTCSCENGRYLASIMDDRVMTCDKIFEEETKTVTTNFNEKNAICKTKNVYILLAFLLITITLLIAVEIERILKILCVIIPMR